MDATIEEGILKSNTPVQQLAPMTAEQVGNAWAIDGIKEALAKGTPEECKFYLQSLREMALHLLANECFNEGLGMTRKNVNHTPSWKERRFNEAFSNMNQDLLQKVSVLIQMGKEGKLNQLDLKNTEEEPAVEDDMNKVLPLRKEQSEGVEA